MENEKYNEIELIEIEHKRKKILNRIINKLKRMIKI